MGTPDFAVPALNAIYEAGHEILMVVSQPDKPVGRHQELMPTAVKAAALKLGLTVKQPVKASDPEFMAEVSALKPDVIVVAAYGKILKKVILDAPKYGCINIHGSLLPRWRGAAPIQWSVLSGDEKSGLTIMQMAEGLDTGDMLMQEETVISPTDTSESLFDRLAKMSGPMIVRALEKLEKGELTAVKQDEALATYASQLSKNMGEIDFNKSVREIDCLIRGMYSWPGAYAKVDGKVFKIHKAEPACVDIEAAPGEFVAVKNDLYVRCQDGFLKLDEVQLEGKKRMNASDFVRGNVSWIRKI